MKNKEFKVGSHIVVSGMKGIVVAIENCFEYNLAFDGKSIGNGKWTGTEEKAQEMRENGYTAEKTGREATYFTVSFENEPSLAGTSYDNGTYGCLDEFENYGTW